MLRQLRARRKASGTTNKSAVFGLQLNGGIFAQSIWVASLSIQRITWQSRVLSEVLGDKFQSLLQ